MGNAILEILELGEQRSRAPQGIPLAVTVDGRRRVLCERPELLLAAPRTLADGEQPFDSFEPGIFEPWPSSLSSMWAWDPVAETLAYAAFLEGLPSSAFNLHSECPVERTEARFFDQGADSNARLDDWVRLRVMLTSAWAWGRTQAGSGEPAIPPPILAVDIAERAVRDPSPLVRTLGFGFALALGQESFLLSTLRGSQQRPERLRAAWAEVGRVWLDFLRAHLSEAVDLTIVLRGQHPRDQFLSAWLPAPTLRTVDVRLVNGGRGPEDLVTRIGLRLPWDDPGTATWLTRRRAKSATVFNDPWPTMMDCASWWLTGLQDAATQLFLFDDRYSEGDGPTEQINRVSMRLPWFQQAYAATVAVAASCVPGFGLSELRRAAKLPPSAGAQPNELVYESKQFVIGRPIADPFQEVRQQLAAPHLARRMPAIVYEAGKTWTNYFVLVSEPVRNLCADVDSALKAVDRFRRVQLFEAELVSWFAGLLHPALTPFDHEIARGWPNAKSPGELMAGDVLPTALLRKNWLAWVVALYARNGQWPAGQPIPKAEQVLASHADTGDEPHCFDTAIVGAGTPLTWLPRNDKLAEHGMITVRRLCLAVWYTKPKAIRLLRELLDRFPPSAEDPRWQAITILACLAAAPLAQGARRNSELTAALQGVLRAAEGTSSPQSRAATEWIKRFLANTKPFPKRPERHQFRG